MKKFLIPSLVVLVVILVIGAIYFIRPKKKETVRVGYLPITASLPLFVGQEQNFFAKQGIEVTPVKFEASNTMSDALLQGQIDVETSAASTVAFLVEEKTPGKFKVFGDNTNGTQDPLSALLVKSDSKINSISDLKGKKIGSFPGVQAVTLLKRYLKMNGLDPEKDVQIQEMKQDLQLQSLTSGQIDAVLSYEPNPTIAIANGSAKAIVVDVLSRASVDPYPTGVFAFSQSFINKNPAVAKRFVKAFDKSMDYSNANQMTTRSYLPKFMPIDENTSQNVPLPHFETLKNLDISGMQKLANVFFEEGVLKKQPVVSDFLYK